MKITIDEALKRLLCRSITNMNVNLDYEFPLAETAIEILGCIRLAKNLASVGHDTNPNKFDASHIIHLIGRDDLYKAVCACPNAIEAIALLKMELEKVWAKLRGSRYKPLIGGESYTGMDWQKYAERLQEAIQTLSIGTW